ncbi:MAG: histidine kinase dimerization/phosphoacceptor domain -containing protein, partial [Waterburya sp.]
VEHAFVDYSKGNILLSAKKNSCGEITLIVKDDGIGCTDPKILHESESLGMNLIATLVEQLEGTLEIKCCHGTEITITFKELNYKDRL